MKAIVYCRGSLSLSLCSASLCCSRHSFFLEDGHAEGRPRTGGGHSSDKPSDIQRLVQQRQTEQDLKQEVERVLVRCGQSSELGWCSELARWRKSVGQVE